MDSTLLLLPLCAGAAVGVVAVTLSNVLILYYRQYSPLAVVPAAYPLVPWVPGAAVACSILMAILAAHATGRAPWWAIAISGAELLVLAITFLVDLKVHLILDIVTYPAIAGLLFLAVWLPDRSWPIVVIGGITGLLIYLALYGLGWLLTRQEALGIGDIKLAALIGVMLGWQHIIQALVVSSVIAGVVSATLLLLRLRRRNSFIPYGVFLAFGAAFYVVTG